MKIAGILVVVAAAFGIGFLVAKSEVSPDVKAFDFKTATNDDVSLQIYESLVYHLSDTKQTNALRDLNVFLDDQRTRQDGADLAVTVAVLQALRDGKTNEMFRYFEDHLDSQVGLFGSGYSLLPVALQKQQSLKPLRQARDYRTKFPHENTNRISREAVTNAFEILDDR